MIKCIDHVGISVSDLERSLAFYGGVLGLELIDRETIADETIADLTGYDAVEMDCADLDSGDGRILELIQYRIPAAEPRRRPRRRTRRARGQRGACHLATAGALRGARLALGRCALRLRRRSGRRGAGAGAAADDEGVTPTEAAGTHHCMPRRIV